MTRAPSGSPASEADEVLAEGGVDYGILPELIGFNLRISYGIASLVFTRTFEPLDLAPLQFAALEVICRNPDLSQTEIAEHIGTTPPVLVSPLERLERRGLIVRQRDPQDRRRSRVRSTPEGDELMAEARERIASVEDELTDRLAPWERDTLLALLQRLTGRG